jgi:dihydrofolate synthase/folylpolyglutamate synthase
LTDYLRPHDAALERLRALHPLKIDLSLDRMERLCAALKRPQCRLPPVIHVAGTNGKGSTIAFLRAMAEAAGLRVHVFTSPHLVRFAERIRLAGTLISEDHLGDLLARVEAANAGEPITFFEITTVAALLAFAETPADLCLIEVGLGGRFDATNVIERPAVSVIAPVALDHCEFLGDTIDKIAGEKAGIIRPGVPCISARQDDGASTVIRAVAERAGSSLSLAGRDFDTWAENGGIMYKDRAGVLRLPSARLSGVHQIENAGLALAAARMLELPDASIAEGLGSATWPARMQRLTTGPLAERATARGADLWLDAGHNPHAMGAIAKTLTDFRREDGRPIVVVLGLLANKDAKGVFGSLRPVLPFRLILVGFEADAAADPAMLAKSAREAGLNAEIAHDVSAALEATLTKEGPPPHVLICGSLYLAGEVLAMNPESWPR